MRLRSKFAGLVGIFAGLVVAAGASRAGATTINITYQVNALSPINISRAPNSGNDTLTLNGVTSNTITLTDGVAVDKPINKVNFSISATGSNQGGSFSSSFSPTMQVTLPSSTSNPLTQNYTDTFNAGGNHVDQLSIAAATAITFNLGVNGTLTVTPKAVTYAAGAVSNGALTGTFLWTAPTPEPGSLSLLGIGAAGLLARRRA